MPRVPRRTLLLAWFLALACLQVRAQSLAFRRFDHRDGLPQSQVTCLLEDRLGFIWVGTLQGGAARLGSSGFTHFGPNQGLLGRSVSALLEDREGAIWVATQDMGVARIRGNQILNFGPERGLPVREIFSLGLDPGGRVLAGTRQGLFRCEGTRFEAVSLPPPFAKSPIFNLGIGPNGDLWVSSHRGQLARWDGRALHPALLPADWAQETVLDLERDPKGALWAVQSQGLARLTEGDQWERVHLDLPEGVKRRSLTFDTQGRMILSLDGDGVLIHDPLTKDRRLTARDGLPRDRINVAIMDRHGSLWVGSDGDGLAVEVLPELRVISQNPETGASLGLGAVTRFLELGPGDVLIATNNGLFRWGEDRGIFSRWAEGQGLPSSEVWALESDRQGGVWVGTNKGICRWVNGRIVSGGPKELQEAAVVRLLVHQDRLWAGTDLGLFELDLQGRFLKRHRPPAEVGPQATYDLLPFGPGLLVGTSLGLYDFRDGLFTKQVVNAPFASLPITCIDQDARGGIWIGTSEGLFGLPVPGGGPGLIRWGRRQGLLDDNVSWSRMLPDGTLAIGHSRGLSLVREGKVIPLTHAQGLLSDETNHDAVLVDSQRRVWIGMIGGLCILGTRQPVPASDLPAPRILEVLAGKERFWLPGPLRLPARPEELQITFDVAMPASPTRPLYQVWMEGVDEAWRQADSQNPLQYMKPSPGRYRFRVRASLDGRSWVESEPLPIEVPPAWFQRRVVQALFILAALGAGALLVNLRIRRLRRRADELEYWVHKRTEALVQRNRDVEKAHARIKRALEDRMQLLDRVAHDLRSPLTTILLSMDRLRERTDAQGELSPTLAVMERETQRLEAILRTLLNKSKAESLFDNLQVALTDPAEILEGISETLSIKAEAKGLDCAVDSDAASRGARVRVDLTAMHQVLFNLVENALKFTPPGGRMGIRSRVEGDRWILEVWDTGRGMSLQELGRIFEPFRQNRAADAGEGWGLGLSICRALVDAHAGDLTVESTEGEGSTFRVSLPLVREAEPVPAG